MEWEQVERRGGFDSTASTSDETRVLHVDDEPQFGELVTTYLEKLDDAITVFTEPSAEAGLDRLETEPVDCIISDYDMPGTDGIGFLKSVRERYPNLPFILFTGKGSEAVASEAIASGVTNYLQKEGSESYELLTNRVQNAVDHHRSKRLAQVTEDRLFGLYEQADGFYILDDQWTITYWNQRIADRTGRPAEDVLGKSYWDVFPEARELETEDQFRTAIETQSPVRFEVWYEPDDYWTEVRAFPIEEGLFVHSRNITDLKEREQEIERRNHILESFANTVSHDLQNPLTIAEGRLELAQETGDLGHLDEVAKAHNRMQNLIDDLLSIARGEDPEPTVVSVRELGQKAWGTVSTEGMELVVVADVRFEAYPSQLRQLFENLFWNALEHGEAETVRIGVLDGGIYVEDDGRGVPADEREKIFESGYSTADDGSGYGLHIVKNIVDFHDWQITATEGDDGGARFEIRGLQTSGA